MDYGKDLFRNERSNQIAFTTSILMRRTEKNHLFQKTNSSCIMIFQNILCLSSWKNISKIVNSKKCLTHIARRRTCATANCTCSCAHSHSQPILWVQLYAPHNPFHSDAFATILVYLEYIFFKSWPIPANSSSSESCQYLLKFTTLLAFTQIKTLVWGGWQSCQGLTKK